MPHADAEPLREIYRLLDDFVRRLPQGERADDVRRALADARDAIRERRGVEDAIRQLVIALHQFDEDSVGGRRREFQRNTPAVGRLLEALQEELLPRLRGAGYQV
jgi:hypothetical protein